MGANFCGHLEREQFGVFWGKARFKSSAQCKHSSNAWYAEQTCVAPRSGGATINEMFTNIAVSSLRATILPCLSEMGPQSTTHTILLVQTKLAFNWGNKMQGLQLNARLDFSCKRTSPWYIFFMHWYSAAHSKGGFSGKGREDASIHLRPQTWAEHLACR